LYVVRVVELEFKTTYYIQAVTVLFPLGVWHQFYSTTYKGDPFQQGAYQVRDDGNHFSSWLDCGSLSAAH
jgi:hypothetical protein